MNVKGSEFPGPAAPTASVPSCPACGSVGISRTFVVREMMFGTGDSFEYVECEKCSTVRLLDVPHDLSPFYRTDYYSIARDPTVVLGRFPTRQIVRHVVRSAVTGRGASAAVAQALTRRPEFQKLSSVRLAGLPRGRSSTVLDVGCGSGQLLYALSLAGIDDVLGIDPFAPGDRTFDTGASILRQHLSDVEGTFDLVMLHHSLEHVPDPGGILRQVRGLLSPQGRIVVRMPTVSSRAYSIYQQDWVQLDAPRHLAVLSRSGMAELCRANGLQVVTVRDDSTSFQFWGSEQVRRRIPLSRAGSHTGDPEGSRFTRAQLARWGRAATEANRAGEGDQAAWVLRPAQPERDDEDRPG